MTAERFLREAWDPPENSNQTKGRVSDMDDARAETSKTSKNSKRKKTTSAKAEQAAARAINIASLISGAVKPGARLVVDMPVGGKGLFRLALSEPDRRLTAWGEDMDAAVKQLMDKITG